MSTLAIEPTRSRGGARRLRVGLDVRECVAGRRTGIGSYVATLIARWRQPDAAVEPVLYGNQRTVLPPPVADAPVQVIPEHATIWWDQVSLSRALARDRVDVFLSPYYKAPLAAPCPVVVTIHDLLFLDETLYPARGRRRLARAAVVRLARAVARRAARVITDSEHSRADIERRLGVPRDKLRVIPIGLAPALARVDDPDALHRVRTTYGLAERYVLYVGNFKPHKNLARVVQAWARVPASIRDTHQLVLAGSRDEHTGALEMLAGSLGLGAGVRCPGFVADADLAALYSGATAVVLASLYEGFGVPVIEAMACGTPVVCSGTTSLAEVAGDAAVLVDPASEAAITDGLGRVLADAALRHRLVAAGRRRVQEFAADRSGAAVEAVLAEAARARD